MTLKEIISEVYGVDLTKRTRDRRFVEARQAFCFFCREYTKMGVVEIGNEIGLKHSTVSYGTRHYYDILHYADVKERYDKIIDKIEQNGKITEIN